VDGAGVVGGSAIDIRSRAVNVNQAPDSLVWRDRVETPSRHRDARALVGAFNLRRRPTADCLELRGGWTMDSPIDGSGKSGG
jgi:hypothetical protein